MAEADANEGGGEDSNTPVGIGVQAETEGIFDFSVVNKETREPMAGVQLYIKIDKEKSEDTTDKKGQCKIIIGDANYLAITAKEEGFVPMGLYYRKDENT